MSASKYFKIKIYILLYFEAPDNVKSYAVGYLAYTSKIPILQPGYGCFP
jgi:hypothetical protein